MNNETFVEDLPSYPRRDDPELPKKMAAKKEFSMINQEESKLFPHQLFVRAFLSWRTPYRELLLFHSMGSGKSFSSIAVSEDYRAFFSSPPLVLVRGESSANNFRKQVKKWREICSESAALGVAPHFGYLNGGAVQNAYHLDAEYDIRTFISFSRRLQNLLDEEVIKEYDGRVIIVDEVQNVRSSEENQGFVYEQIKRLIKLLPNRVVLLLTGTPMIDKRQEIRGVMNLIVKNPLSKSDLDNKEKFIAKTRGYVSFVELESAYDKTQESGKPEVIEAGETIHPLSIKVVVSHMRGIQLEAYTKSIEKEMKGAIYRQPIYASLFVLPNGEYGEKAYLNVNSPGDAPHFSEHIRKEIKTNYRQYSCKMHQAMKFIRSSPGPVFIFCEEVKGSGLMLIASLLEALGYKMYKGEEIAFLQKKERYTIYVGDKFLCPNPHERLNGFCSDENARGEYVRILLGSRISGEGISLRNVRQVHIMTPHWNVFSTNQAIARAVRLDSHLLLDAKERNVTVFRHVAALSGTPSDRQAAQKDDLFSPYTSIDLYKYITSQAKEREVLTIKEWLRENSVDKFIYASDASSLPYSRLPSDLPYGRGKEKIDESTYLILRARQEPVSARKVIDLANNQIVLLDARVKEVFFNDDRELIEWCINTDIAEKALALEKEILMGKNRLTWFFRRSIAKTNCKHEPWIHMLLCRKPNEASSYAISSSSLKSNGRLRVLREGQWSFYGKNDAKIMEMFSREQEKFLRNLNNNYIIISNGDNSVRLVLVNEQKHDDKRKRNRGKRIESFSTTELIAVLLAVRPSSKVGRAGSPVPSVPPALNLIVPRGNNQGMVGSRGTDADNFFQMSKLQIRSILIEDFVSRKKYVVL